MKERARRAVSVEIFVQPANLHRRHHGQISAHRKPPFGTNAQLRLHTADRGAADGKTNRASLGLGQAALGKADTGQHEARFNLPLGCIEADAGTGQTTAARAVGVALRLHAVGAEGSRGRAFREQTARLHFDESDALPQAAVHTDLESLTGE